MSYSNFKAQSDGFVVDIKLDRFNVQASKAQKWLDSQVIVDSTPYVPMRTGALYRSAITGNDIGSGMVVWDTAYARRCYYGFDMNFRKDKHPKAQAQWFEAAKATCKLTWIRIAKRMGGGG